jgi:integrase
LPPLVDEAADLIISEMIEVYWKYAEKHYRRPDGTPTNELSEIRRAFKPLRSMYGQTAVKDFGPLALKAVRQKMVEAGWSRGVINQRIGRIKRAFKWGVENELVPPLVLRGLQAVLGLQRGRSAAHETEPVKPVPLASVEAAIPHMPLLQHSGMRPGEACIMRGIDLCTSGPIWFYRPAQHKTAWRGHERLIALGPKAQDVLRLWLRLNVEEYLFQPIEARAVYDAGRRQRRQTPLTPSHRARRPKKKPRRRPGERYTPESLTHAVVRASIHVHGLVCAQCKRQKKRPGTTGSAGAVSAPGCAPSSGHLASLISRMVRSCWCVCQ